MGRLGSRVSSGAARGPTSGVALESEPEIIREARGKALNIWDEEGNIDPSLTDGQICGPTLSTEIREDTMSATKEGVAVVNFLIWLDIERKPVLTIGEMAEVPCIW
jgi:hypothetical protein